MVAAVDQRDGDRRAGEAIGRFQAAETRTDDHHAMGIWRARGLCRHGNAPLVFDPLPDTALYVAPLRFGPSADALQIRQIVRYEKRIGRCCRVYEPCGSRASSMR